MPLVFIPMSDDNGVTEGFLQECKHAVRYFCILDNNRFYPGLLAIENIRIGENGIKYSFAIYLLLAI